MSVNLWANQRTWVPVRGHGGVTFGPCDSDSNSNYTAEGIPQASTRETTAAAGHKTLVKAKRLSGKKREK